ncbi:acyltransferase family protein [Pseudomonas sp. Ma2-10]
MMPGEKNISGPPQFEKTSTIPNAKKLYTAGSVINSKRETTSLDYLRGLDGLRGIAVLSVIFGHFGVPGFSVGGGYGVDVFFVLSGYLITCVLMRSIEEGRPLAIFYWHRVARLLPALLLVCLSLFLIPSHYLTTSGALVNAIGALTYVTNWTMAFPVLGWPTYMAHTWSLSVEEQFYLIWPVILWLASKKKTKTVVFTVTALSFFYLIAMILNGASNVRLDTGFDTHCQAILIGACLAFVRPLGIDSKIAGAALIAYFILVFFVPWSPIGATTIWILTFVLIDSIRDRSKLGLVHKFLESKPLVFLGVISYGAYLWHYPVYNLLKNFPAPISITVTAGVTVSIALAYLTRILVEVPILRFRSSSSDSFSIRAGKISAVISITSMLVGLIFFYGGFIQTSPY